MTRIHCIAILLTLCAGLSALETSLVIRPPGQGSDQVVVINPTIGTLQLYRANNQLMEQVDAHNFLADLDRLSKQPVPAKRDWVLLRTGSPNTQPTYGQIFDQFSKFPKPSDPNVQPFAVRANAAEDDFWSQIPAYDGVVRGAMLDNALALVIPSSYTILFYYIQNNEISLAGWRNYRADLFVPQVLNSSPSPAEILRALPQDVQAERKERMEQQLEEMGDDAGATISVAASDPWIAASDSSGQIFILVDPANMRLMTYQFRSRGGGSEFNMLSVRNLEIDLMIPTTYKSEPDVSDLVRRYNAQLKKKRLPPVNRDYLESLLGEKSVAAENASKFHVVLDPSGNIIIDFPEERQLLLYRAFGSGNGSELISARDYTVEAGIGIHSQDIQRRQDALALLPAIEKGARRDIDESFRMAAIALDWNPWLYKDIEKKLGRALGKDERWQPMLEGAIAEATRRDEQYKRIMEAAEQRAKDREARRGN